MIGDRVILADLDADLDAAGEINTDTGGFGGRGFPGGGPLPEGWGEPAARCRECRSSAGRHRVIKMSVIEDHFCMKLDAVTPYDCTHQQQGRPPCRRRRAPSGARVGAVGLGPRRQAPPNHN
ncbi:MAG: hypothetical protein Q8Q02_10640 [Nocardioides sp.]|nr:hypothetical protein [Nocardioides sp.]